MRNFYGSLLYEAGQVVFVNRRTGEAAVLSGGDEFVLFIADADEADIKARRQALAQDLSKDAYHISVGIQCERDVSSMPLLIKGAEQKMYAEKKEYYEKHDRRRKPET